MGVTRQERRQEEGGEEDGMLGWNLLFEFLFSFFFFFAVPYIFLCVNLFSTPFVNITSHFEFFF